MLDTQERQIRFIYPPVFLAGSLLFALWLDPRRSFENILPGILSSESSARLVTALATGTIRLIASGFAISSLTVLAVREYFARRGWRPYEAALDDAELNAIHTLLELKCDRDETHTLYLSATFDHEFLKDGVHRWIQRRWGTFYLSANSAVALILAVGLGLALGISPKWQWLLLSLSITGVFLRISQWAWLDTMGMLKFQASRPLRAFAKVEPPAQPGADTKVASPPASLQS